jgi:hypothetical protein
MATVVPVAVLVTALIMQKRGASVSVRFVTSGALVLSLLLIYMIAISYNT